MQDNNEEINAPRLADCVDGKWVNAKLAEFSLKLKPLCNEIGLNYHAVYAWVQGDRTPPATHQQAFYLHFFYLFRLRELDKLEKAMKNCIQEIKNRTLSE